MTVQQIVHALITKRSNVNPNAPAFSTTRNLGNVGTALIAACYGKNPRS